MYGGNGKTDWLYPAACSEEDRTGSGDHGGTADHDTGRYRYNTGIFYNCNPYFSSDSVTLY